MTPIAWRQLLLGMLVGTALGAAVGVSFTNRARVREREDRGPWAWENLAQFTDPNEACEGGIADSCLSAGRLALVDESGAPRGDDARMRAAELFRRSCRLGSLEGCYRWATRDTRDEGRDVPLTIAEEWAHLNELCRIGERLSCHTIAVAYSRGEYYQNIFDPRAGEITLGGPDLAMSLRYHHLSCRLDYVHACEASTDPIFWGAEGVDPVHFSPAAQLRWLERSCFGGNRESCNDARDLSSEIEAFEWPLWSDASRPVRSLILTWEQNRRRIAVLSSQLDGLRNERSLLTFQTSRAIVAAGELRATPAERENWAPPELSGLPQ